MAAPVAPFPMAWFFGASPERPNLFGREPYLATNLVGLTGFSPPMLEAWVMVLGGSSVALQLSSQRSNVDFKPIVDHYSAVEYATKYATKKEKGSKPFDRWCARLNSGGRAEAESVAQSVAAEESSVLQYIATWGGRAVAIGARAVKR